MRTRARQAPLTRQVFHELVREQAAAGITVLFSTHMMDHMARLCSRAVILSHGRVVADAQLDALRDAYPGLTLDSAFLQLTAGPAAT